MTPTPGPSDPSGAQPAAAAAGGQSRGTTA